MLNGIEARRKAANIGMFTAFVPTNPEPTFMAFTNDSNFTFENVSQEKLNSICPAECPAYKPMIVQQDCANARKSASGNLYVVRQVFYSEN